MKRIFAVCMFALMLGCAPDEATPTKPIDDTFDPTGATLLRSGTLMGCGGHTVMGKAEVYEKDGNLSLVFDDFTSQNGPDLRVYLSTTDNASSFVNLGDLKSTTGKQSYEIPAGTDLDTYKYAHVWCQQFSVCFGVALTD
jgi:hypothetical protein